MLYLLDTNVISELRKVRTGKAHPHFAVWAEEISITDTFISAITVLEIERGILRKEQSDSLQGKRLRHWFEEVIFEEYQQRILPVDKAVALQCAKLHIPNKRCEADSMIAATAMVHRLAVVTRNTLDFKGIDIVLINPWD